MQEEELGMHGIDDEEEAEDGWELRTRSGGGGGIKFSNVGFVHFLQISTVCGADISIKFGHASSALSSQPVILI